MRETEVKRRARQERECLKEGGCIRTQWGTLERWLGRRLENLAALKALRFPRGRETAGVDGGPGTPWRRLREHHRAARKASGRKDFPSLKVWARNVYGGPQPQWGLK